MQFDLDIEQEPFKKLLERKEKELINQRRPVKNYVIALENTKLMQTDGQFETIKEVVIKFARVLNQQDGGILQFKLDVIVFNSDTSEPIKFSNINQFESEIKALITINKEVQVNHQCLDLKIKKILNEYAKAYKMQDLNLIIISATEFMPTDL